jgi:Uma2 family endonuclease
MAVSESNNGNETWTIPAHLRLELLAALSAKSSGRITMAWEEFLDWADEDTLAEWVNGEVVMTSPASARHQDVVGFLYGILKTYVTLRQAGKVLAAPFQMKLEHSGRGPDILFIATDHLARLKATFLDGPADLVVEVLSPESVGRDRGEKFFEYQKASIPEHWLIDPETERAEFYQLNEQGKYQIILPDQDGIYRSRTLQGFWLREELLWLDPLPEVEDVLLDIGGDAYVRHVMERLRKRGVLPGEPPK